MAANASPPQPGPKPSGRLVLLKMPPALVSDDQIAAAVEGLLPLEGVVLAGAPPQRTPPAEPQQQQQQQHVSSSDKKRKAPETSSEAATAAAEQQTTGGRSRRAASGKQGVQEDSGSDWDDDSDEEPSKGGCLFWVLFAYRGSSIFCGCFVRRLLGIWVHAGRWFLACGCCPIGCLPTCPPACKPLYCLL